MLVEPDDINWHDGVLIDIQLSGFCGESQQIVLVADLYPDDDTNIPRKRYRCIGTGLRRYVVTGETARLIKNRAAGNIDFMRMDGRADGDGDVIVIMLFGGMIEAEAASFDLIELQA